MRVVAKHPPDLGDLYPAVLLSRLVFLPTSQVGKPFYYQEFIFGVELNPGPPRLEQFESLY